MFRVEQMLRERGAAGEQVEARPTWTRVPERRSVREGNEGLKKSDIFLEIFSSRQGSGVSAPLNC